MNICVFGSLSENVEQKFFNMGEKFGKALADHGHTLVYGGGRDGLLGRVAEEAKNAGAKVIGVIPEGFKNSSYVFDRCDKIYEEVDLSKRKQKMNDLSDAFVVLPGGMGTLDEFSDICNRYIKKEDFKKIIIYNYQHYYDGLLSFLHRAESFHIMGHDWKEKVIVSEDMQMIFMELMK